jgi:hypothetical protein
MCSGHYDAGSVEVVCNPPPTPICTCSRLMWGSWEAFRASDALKERWKGKCSGTPAAGWQEFLPLGGVPRVLAP